MFPPDKGKAGSDKKKPAGPPGKGGPPNQGGPPSQGGPPGQQPQGSGLGEAISRPFAGPKPGQGMDPMAAMMQGMGDLSHLGPPPPPAPGVPMGEGGLPFGGGMPSEDPGMDPNMDGSGLFKALMASLDPYAAPPEGHAPLGDVGTGDPGMGLDELLAILALAKSGAAGGGLNPSGQGNDPSHAGMMMGMQNPNLMV